LADALLVAYVEAAMVVVAEVHFWEEGVAVEVRF
jgi:hypothetical protein